MKRIAAAENLLIDMEAQRWLLVTNPNGDPQGSRVVIEAAVGQPLRYMDGFANTRRLPKNGELPVDYIREVVLGWSHTDEAWHLGLLLGPSLAEVRGSRWCEIAYWPDPDTTVFLDLAREAGQTLAHTLNRPFELIPPRPRTVVEAPPVPLPPLPLQFGMWSLDHQAGDESAPLQLTRSRSWTVSRLMRIGWYLLWVVVYIILSVSTLNTDLALPNAGTMLPNPELLPYLGLAAAGILVVMILFILYELLSQPDRVIIDQNQRTVTAQRGKSVRWQLTADDLQSVYVTQIVSQRGKRRTIYHGELNLHLGGGDFQQVIQQQQQEESDFPPGEPPAEEAIQPLERDQTMTDLQVAGLYIADAMGGLPCWYDQRTR